MAKRRVTKKVEDGAPIESGKGESKKFVSLVSVTLHVTVRTETRGCSSDAAQEEASDKIAALEIPGMTIESFKIEDVRDA